MTNTRLTQLLRLVHLANDMPTKWADTIDAIHEDIIEICFGIDAPAPAAPEHIEDAQTILSAVIGTLGDTVEAEALLRVNDRLDQVYTELTKTTAPATPVEVPVGIPDAYRIQDYRIHVDTVDGPVKDDGPWLIVTHDGHPVIARNHKIVHADKDQLPNTDYTWEAKDHGWYTDAEVNPIMPLVPLNTEEPQPTTYPEADE